MEKTTRTPCLEEMPIADGSHHRSFRPHHSETEIAMIQKRGVGIWLSTLCVNGVLPLVLLLALTGFSVWTISGLIWLFVATVYVGIALVRADRTEDTERRREILWHAGVRLGYVIFAMILFFILQVGVAGIVALILPLFPDSAIQWFVAPKSRKHIMLRVPVFLFVILVLLWLNSRL